MILQPEKIQTPRLKFRFMEGNDFDALLPFFKSKEAVRFLFPTTSPEEFCKRWIERQLERYKNQGNGLCLIISKEKNEVIGQCGLLLQIPEQSPEWEIGYSLFPDYWHQGFATEAAQAFRDYAFESGLTNSLISLIHVENLNSQRVAIRNGMHQEKQITFKDHPTFIYRINYEEWVGR